MVGNYSAFTVILAYLAFSMLMTGGVVFQLDSVLFGDFGDARGVIWSQWAKNSGYLNGSHNPLISAPFGMPTESALSTPIGEWLGSLFNMFYDEIGSYNLFVFFSFPLTAFCTYLFLNSLVKQKSAAFVGGLIFGFCPGSVLQVAGGHAAFAFNLFVPLFLWALFYNRAQRTTFSALCVATSFSLIVLSALYFGYMAIYIALYFIAFDLYSSKDGNWIRKSLNYIYGGIFALLIIIPFEYKAIYQQFLLSSDVLIKAGRIRDFSELTIYSSRPWDYLLPSVDHPMLGNYFYDFIRRHLHGSNIYEQTLYLGMVPLGLFLAGFALIWRKKFEPQARVYFLFFSFGALWLYFISLPPMISFGDEKFPTLSSLAYNIAPMFRVYSRFGILVNFFVACSVAVVLVQLYRHMKSTRFYAMLAVLLSAMFFEYWSLPPSYASPVNQPPEVYSWLAKQPEDFVIAEYPMMNRDEASFYSYLFWQRIHKKRLINGATQNHKVAWELFEQVQDIEGKKTLPLLKSAGVKYVIIHSEMYRQGPIPYSVKRYYPPEYANASYNGGRTPPVPFPLKLVKAFGSDYVFSWAGDTVASESNLHSR